jgi:hypothetical protein
MGEQRERGGGGIGRQWAMPAATVLALLAGACAEGGGTPDGRDAPDAADETAPEVPEARDAPDGETAPGPAPALGGISPTAGPTEGGTLVTLTGENFASGAPVTCDGVPCTETFVASARRTTCRTPPHAAGSATVLLTNPDGQRASLEGGFTYDDASAPEIDWCALHYPPWFSVHPEEATGPAYGRVFVGTVTEGDGQGPGVRAQIGVGAVGEDPTAWTWADAAYNVSVDGMTAGDLANDEYAATLPGRAAGEYLYAFRFSVDDGATWTTCDLTGTEDGFAAADAGALHVVATPVATIGWCRVDRPAATTADAGEETEPIFSRVFVAGVTAGEGQGAGVQGGIGVGPAASAPEESSWTWTAAAYAASVDGLAPGDLANDEYSTAIDAPGAPGEWLYAARFSVDGGTTWTYCDLAGAGYGAANAGRLTVTDPSVGPLVGWCNVQWPSSLAGERGVPTEYVYGRVWVDGVTPGAGRGAGIRGQLGFGTPGSDPSGWSWLDADFNVDVDGMSAGDLANDEYWQRLTVETAGSYAYAYRFSLDDGGSWRYCDLDGSGGMAGDFSADQAGALTVE